MLYCKSLGYEKFTSNPTFLQDFTTGFLLGSRYGKILPIKLKLVGMQSKIFYQIFFLSQLGPLQCVWHKKSQIKSKLKFGKYWAGPPTREIVMKSIQEVIHHSKNRIINSPSAKAIMALLGPVLFWSKHKVCTARLAKRIAYPFDFFSTPSSWNQGLSFGGG